MKAYEEIENRVKKISTAHLKRLIDMFGLEVELEAHTNDNYDAAMGVLSGTRTTSATTSTILVLITTNQYKPVSVSQAGQLMGGYMFAKSGINDGDLVWVKGRTDSKTRAFKVINNEGIGMTGNINTRYEIAAVEKTS